MALLFLQHFSILSRWLVFFTLQLHFDANLKWTLGSTSLKPLSRSLSLTLSVPLSLPCSLYALSGILCVCFCALWCLCNCNWCWLFDSLNVENEQMNGTYRERLCWSEGECCSAFNEGGGVGEGYPILLFSVFLSSTVTWNDNSD